MIVDLPDWISGLLMPCPMSGCWLYFGPERSSNGYGRISILGKEYQLHRVVYEILVRPLLKIEILDHKCRVRYCSNPYHLEPVNVKINTHRGKAWLFKKPEDYHVR